MNNKFFTKTACTAAMAAMLLGLSQPAFAEGAAPTAENNVVTAETQANTPSWNGTVELAKQYNEQTDGFDKSVSKQFTNPTDKLGTATAHEGLFRHLQTNFICWSTMPQEANGDIPAGAKIFTADDTVQTAFPEGLKGGEKLYAVYVSVVDATDPNYVAANGDDAVGLDRLVNKDNKAKVNEAVAPEDVLLDTKLEKFEESVDPDTNRPVKKVLDVYSEKDDVKTINEVVVKATFEMNNRIALLVHKNPRFGYEGKRVLTENYATQEFSFAKGKDAGYTYVDLVLNLDERLTVPKEFYLKFTAYSWRPLYVLDAGYTKALEIANPTTGANLGNAKDAFKTLVSNTTPDVLFKVSNPDGLKSFVIRTILRDGDERIENIQGDASQSIASKIVSKMDLVSLSSAELVKMGFSKEEANQKVLRVADGEAKKLAATNGKDVLTVFGFIEGIARSSIGTIAGFDTENFTTVKRVDSEILQLGYIKEVTIELPTSPIEKVGASVTIELPTYVLPKVEPTKPQTPKAQKVVLVKKQPTLVDTGVDGIVGASIAIVVLAVVGVGALFLRRKAN